MDTARTDGRMLTVARWAWLRRLTAVLAVAAVAWAWTVEARRVVRRPLRRVRIVRPNRTVVVARRKPPLVKVEVKPDRPGPRHVWRPGHWAFRDDEWVWIAGVWVLPPNDGDAWIPAKWIKTPDGWQLVEGHWK